MFTQHRTITSRRGRLVLGAALALSVTAALAGCSSGDPLGADSATPADSTTITIGSQGFAESEILAQIYGQVLAANGYTVDYNPGIGSREAFVPGLKDGSIDMIPEYSGNLLQFLDPSASASSSEEIAAALPAALEPEGLTVLDAAPAEDADSLVVTPEFAAANNLVTIADLAPIASTITLGANTEFQTRPYGQSGLESVYGVTGYTFKAIDDFGGPGTLSDLLAGNIQVADIYTTTPSIKQNNLVILEDPENLIAAQNVVPLMNTSVYSDALAALLNPVSAKLTTAGVLDLNEKSNSDAKPSPEKLATEWLTTNGFL
ncbi:ABC transporter substrate-binding protein [Cryobacterium sp. Y57]|uniref:ABC transporter substrate-binding protein n=1 Tax=Cryobacterium sp. Y57 TaxID=2048287 RepID=UPI000CE41483|nr:ABC transporter substrate-binding protein [Cryobacterium sp. Y57]